jgi:hypothetical protein
LRGGDPVQASGAPINEAGTLPPAQKELGRSIPFRMASGSSAIELFMGLKGIKRE